MIDHRSNRPLPLVNGRASALGGPRPSHSIAGAKTEEARPRVRDIVEEWGQHSFPASDPPANW